MEKTRVIIMGAAGRDFHNFNVFFRDNPAYEVVAFTATQIPNFTHILLSNPAARLLGTVADGRLAAGSLQTVAAHALATGETIRDEVVLTARPGRDSVWISVSAIPLSSGPRHFGHWPGSDASRSWQAAPHRMLAEIFK